MRPTFPAGFRVGCAALALVLGALARAAEPHPLMGATRDDVLARYGEPRSTLVGGGREILFYARERLVLRGGKVVEVERIAAEPVRQPRPQPAAPAPSAVVPAAPETTAAASTASTTKAPAPVAPVIAPSPSESPAQRGLPPLPAGTEAAAAGVQPSVAPEPDVPPEPKLEIKRVLPRGTKSAPIVRTGEAAPAASPPAATPAPAAAAASPTPAPTTEAATASATPSSSSSPLASAPAPAAETATTVPEAPPAPTTEDADELAKKEKAKRALEVKAARRRLEAASEDASYDPTKAFFNKRTYLITAFIVLGGAAYIVWRRRQRQIALIATAVSREPFAGHTETRGSGAIFTAELLAKLEWKHFEELVAAYYNKTGVVATRTKSGPHAPVHLKISWKGESRPFALVQCIAQPPGLVPAKSLQELNEVLVKEDIRRGYVVSAGKFSVPARDVAEEKHLTLLPGDIFLEKLNALPDLARNEIMQAITAGDYTTPVCPKCEARMVRAPEDANLYRCATHFDQQIAAKKPTP